MGTVRTIRAALPHLIASRPGSVVNVASAVALTGFANRALYTASKGAVVALTRAAAADHIDGRRAIQRCVPRHDGDAVDPAAALGRRRPGRGASDARGPAAAPPPVSAEEVADAILYLAHPLAQSTNGIVLSVDAGIQSLYRAS